VGRWRAVVKNSAHWLLPSVAWLAGCALVIGIFVCSRAAEDRRIASDFEREAFNRAAAIERALQGSRLAMESVHGLFESSEFVSRQEFARFVRPFLRELPGLTALIFVPSIPASERLADWELLGRSELGADFRITRSQTSPVSGECLPVWYAESNVGSGSKQLGVDLASCPAVREGIAAAQANRRVVLVDPGVGFPLATHECGHCLLAILGVRISNPLQADVQGPIATAGAVIGICDYRELLDSVLGSFQPAPLATALLDVTEGAPRILACNRAEDSVVCTLRRGDDGANSRSAWTYETQIGSGSRRWMIVSAADPAFVEARRRWEPWSLLVAGCALSGLIAGFVATTVRRARRSEQLANLSSSRLLESERRFATLVANIPGATYRRSCDPTATVMYISDEIRQVCGLAPEDLGPAISGRTYVDIIFPTDLTGFLAAMAEAVRSREPFSLTYRVVHTDGSVRWVSDRGRAVVSESGCVLWIDGVVFDVTERKRQQDEVLRAGRAAEAANRAKTDFLANMSHEIRTPMTAILGFADELGGQSSDAVTLEAVDTIKRNGEHLLRVIDDILDLSKIEAGRLLVESIACRPWMLVDQVVGLLRLRADRKKLQLDVFHSEPDFEIHSDPTRVRQILLNLIGNAIKFTQTGAVRVECRARREGAKAVIAIDVIDSGIGISELELSRLFKPFSQADCSTSRRFGGTGLGLTISKRLAGLLGGDILVSSRPGQGSTFSLVFEAPLVDTAPPDPLRSAPLPCLTAPIEQLRGRVLLVEDGPDNQRLICRILQRAGLDVVLAENGQQALLQILGTDSVGIAPVPVRTAYDVVLMDMQMPVIDGFEATRRLRRAGYVGPIVALTAHAMAQDVHACLDAGCDAHIPKPIDRTMLLQYIAGLLASKVASTGPG